MCCAECMPNRAAPTVVEQVSHADLRTNPGCRVAACPLCPPAVKTAPGGLRNWLEGTCRMPGDYVTIEVNGHQADQAAMSLLEHEGWGHFTAMQVRGGRTRGLDLHLARLEAAHRDVYGRALGGQEVRAAIRTARGGQLDAGFRVYGYWAGQIVTVREPQDMPRRAQSMT